MDKDLVKHLAKQQKPSPHPHAGSPDPRTQGEAAMRDFKSQLGLDDCAWRSILMSVREPTWEPRGEPRR